MTERYTPEQMLEQADGVEELNLPRTAKMLRQAASDAARIAELEADAERLEWLALECRTVDLFRLLPDWSGDYSSIRQAIDAARSRT